jgi:hypothetical protein
MKMEYMTKARGISINELFILAMIKTAREAGLPYEG